MDQYIKNERCIENDFAAQKELAEMERTNIDKQCEDRLELNALRTRAERAEAKFAMWQDDISAVLKQRDDLHARVVRLEEALREIRDYDTYKHPDESLIALRDAAIKESNECTACQYAKTAKWPPSGLCNEHYRIVTRAEDKVKQMFVYKQTWEPREIARRALEEK